MIDKNANPLQFTNTNVNQNINPTKPKSKHQLLVEFNFEINKLMLEYLRTNNPKLITEKVITLLEELETYND